MTTMIRPALAGVALFMLAACGGGADEPRGQGSATTAGLSCNAASSCPAFSCSCNDGTRWDTARYCFNNVCQGQAATCANACKDRPSATPTVIGCELRKWSNDHSVTMVTYGSGSTEGFATSQASSQCSAADWAGWFCSSAADYCAPEPARATTCRFSKYSPTARRTVEFSGSGLGATAAKRAAVTACLSSGSWRGWFCTSGTLSCSP